MVQTHITENPDVGVEAKSVATPLTSTIKTMTSNRCAILYWFDLSAFRLFIWWRRFGFVRLTIFSLFSFEHVLSTTVRYEVKTTTTMDSLAFFPFTVDKLWCVCMVEWWRWRTQQSVHETIDCAMFYFFGPHWGQTSGCTSLRAKERKRKASTTIQMVYLSNISSVLKSFE